LQPIRHAAQTKAQTDTLEPAKIEETIDRCTFQFYREVRILCSKRTNLELEIAR